MIVITADQVQSGGTADHGSDALRALNRDFTPHLLLAAGGAAGGTAGGTGGAELQLLVAGARPALDIVLRLTRSGRWSVGLGVGDVREPLGASIRESTGDAFVAARAAAERAKKKPTRFAVASEPRGAFCADVESLVDLLLILRARRSPPGWQLRDLVSSGLSQLDAAGQLGISPQSASKRARAADLRAEDAAIPPLARLIDALDAQSGAGSPEQPAAH